MILIYVLIAYFVSNSENGSCLASALHVLDWLVVSFVYDWFRRHASAVPRSPVLLNGVGVVDHTLLHRKNIYINADDLATSCV